MDLPLPPSAPPSNRLRQAGLVCLVAAAAVLAGCASKPSGSPGAAGGATGGYAVGGGDYRKDGPHANPPANLDKVPDAVPRIEPYASGANRPYVINGKQYVPDVTDRPYRVRGMASWYGRQFHGRPTSNGETYDMYAMTAAHPTLPIPSYARVTRADTGKSVIVRINDRGPFHSSRVIDLSYVAAHRLGTLAAGTGEVIVERITPDEIRRGLGQPAPAMIASAPAASPEPVSMQGSARATSTWDGSAPVPTSGFNVAAASATAARAPGSAGVVAADPLSVLAGIPVAGTPVAGIPVPDAPPAVTGAASAVARPAAPTHAAASPTLPAPSAQAAGLGSTGKVAQGMTASGGSAFLQLGAFGEARNAQLLADRLRAHVAQLGRVEVVNQGDNVYRVRLGPFSDRNSAVAQVDAVYGQTGILPHVVTQ